MLSKNGSQFHFYLAPETSWQRISSAGAAVSLIYPCNGCQYNSTWGKIWFFLSQICTVRVWHEHPKTWRTWCLQVLSLELLGRHSNLLWSNFWLIKYRVFGHSASNRRFFRFLCQQLLNWGARFSSFWILYSHILIWVVRISSLCQTCLCLTWSLRVWSYSQDHQNRPKMQNSKCIFYSQKQEKL